MGIIADSHFFLFFYNKSYVPSLHTILSTYQNSLHFTLSLIREKRKEKKKNLQIMFIVRVLINRIFFYDANWCFVYRNININL